MVGLILFFIHYICYWTMVSLYDNNVPDNDLNNAITSSLKNQLLYTLPSTVIFFNYYPIQYSNFLLSIGYIPVLFFGPNKTSMPTDPPSAFLFLKNFL